MIVCIRMEVFESFLTLFIVVVQFQFKESIAQFAQENIAPHASKIDRTNYLPEVIV